MPSEVGDGVKEGMRLVADVCRIMWEGRCGREGRFGTLGRYQLISGISLRTHLSNIRYSILFRYICQGPLWTRRSSERHNSWIERNEAR